MLELPRPASARRSPPAPPDSDEALLDDLRAGRDQAFAELYVRHRRTAAGVARQVVGSGPAVDDVVADAFTSLLSAVRAGGGPSTNVRSYLLTSVRNAAIGYLRARDRTVPVETEVVDRAHHDADALVAADDDHRVRQAFAALPPRWRRALWYADVHELAPAHLSPILGISPNAVSTLVRRARERLRREYLQAHQDRVVAGCEDYAPHLARYVEETLTAPVQYRVGVHVLACEHCTAAVEQMRDLKRRMRAVLLPFGLPVAAAAEPRDGHARRRAEGAGSGVVVLGAMGTVGTWARDRPGVWVRDLLGAWVRDLPDVVTRAVQRLRTLGPSGAGILGPSGARTFGPSGFWALGLGAAAALGGWFRALGRRLQTLARRFRTLVRRLWWSRPRGTERAVLLAIPFVVLSLLVLATVAASDVLDPSGRVEPPPVAENGPTGPGGTPSAGAVGPVPDRSDDGDGPSIGTPPPAWPGDGWRDNGWLGGRWQIGDDSSGRDGGTGHPGSQTPEPEPRPSPEPEPESGPSRTPQPTPTPTPTSPSPSPSPTPTPEPLVLEIAYDDLGDLVPGRTGMLGATVSNPNADPAGVVTVDVTLPADVELDTAGSARAVSAWTCADDAGGLACTVDAVAAGGASTLLVPVLVGAEVPVGTADLRLDVRGEGVVPASADVTVPVSDSPLAARYVATGPVEVALIGAPVLHCDPAAAGCAAVTDGTATGTAQNNNGWNMVAVDALGTGTASSTARLDLPAGSEVLAARLYWAGACSGDVQPVRLAPPGGALTAVAGPVTVDRSGQRYQAGADVTALVRSGGAGTWGVADVCVTEGTAQNAGWALAVVHRPVGAGAEGSGLAIVYDGLMAVTPADPPTFAVAGRPGTAARIGAVAWDGDRANASDRLTLDGTPLVPRLWDGAAAAGSGSATNAFDSTAWGSAYANALGVDAKPFEPASLAASRADLVAQGDADQYTLGVVTVATGS